MRAFASLTALAAAAAGMALLPPALAGDCEKVADVCVEGPATRTIGGHAVTRDCWKFEAQYRCVASSFVDDCQPLRDQGCSPLDTVCTDRSDTGQCLLQQQTWRCRIGGGTSSTVTDCGARRFCLEGHCFDTGFTPDRDFAKAVTGLEAQREAGRTFDANTRAVFTGSRDQCRKKLGGLLNCCRPSSVDGSFLSDLAARTASASPTGASRYTYETLSGDAPSVLDTMSRLDPAMWTSEALSALLACEETEKVLAVKRERHLCHAVGSFCSQRIPIVRSCIETTEAWCCYHSRLARMIHEQGRAQLNRGWGSAEAPDCGGFTVEELQRLDFSRMDLSEFYAEIVPSLPEASAVRARTQQRIETWQAR